MRLLCLLAPAKSARTVGLILFFGSTLIAEPAAAADCSDSPQQNVDACFATPKCAWLQEESRCVKLNEVAKSQQAWVYEPGKPNQLLQYNGQQVSTVTKPAFDQFGLNRQCPSEVLDYLLKYDLAPSLTLPVKLQPVSRWLVWDGGSFSGDDKLKQKVELVQAYHALRREGYCALNRTGGAAAAAGGAAAAAGGAAAAAAAGGVAAAGDAASRLRMSDHAIHNWKQAQPGNVFFGVIDCENWLIYLLPQRRIVEGADQADWKQKDLKKIRWTATGLVYQKKNEKALPALALDLIKGKVVNNSHGHSAGLVAGWNTPDDRTLGDACAYDRKVRANYLGFTVWKRKKADKKADQKKGEPVWVFSSRQLNGANNVNVRPNAEGNNVIEEYLKDEGAQSTREIYKDDGTIKDPTAHNEKTVGLLPAEFQEKIRSLGSEL